MREATPRYRIMHSIRSGISLKVSVPLLLTLPVCVVVVVLSILAFQQGKTTVNDLMTHNLEQIYARIKEHLDTLLYQPGRVHQINTSLIRQGQLDLHNLRAWLLYHEFRCRDVYNVLPLQRRTVNRSPSSMRSGSVPLCSRMPVMTLREIPIPNRSTYP